MKRGRQAWSTWPKKIFIGAITIRGFKYDNDGVLTVSFYIYLRDYNFIYIGGVKRNFIYIGGVISIL